MGHARLGLQVNSVWALLLALAIASGAPAQLPDGFYYKFDGGGASTPNLATPGVGSNPAPVNGHTQGGTGQFGGALQGIGGASTTNFVDTGWPNMLGTGSWTFGFWIDISAVAGTNPFMYVFGDEIVSSFRVFTNGAAGAGNTILRGVGVTDVILPGGAPATGPAVCAWVYDSVATEIRGYVNGVRVATVSQAPLSLSSAGNLKVGGYNTAGALAVGGLMDEFRLYFRALDDTEIADTWDRELGVGCAINSPASMAAVTGTVVVDYDAVHAMMLPVDATFEYSLDMGVSWLLATPGGTSVNPRTGITTPATGLTFEWDTVADGLGLATPAVADLRISVVDAMMGAGSCSVDGLSVDNVPPPPSCTLAQGTPGVAGGVIDFDLVPDSMSAGTVDATFEFSTDGITYLPATPGGASTNPLLSVPIMTPSVFEWDSMADGVGLAMAAAGVTLRASVDDGTPAAGTCETPPFVVDNTALCQGTCGDCDLNASGPDVLDALTAAQIAAGLVAPSMAQQGCCDVNASMTIDVLDALTIAQAAAGLPVTLACP